MRRVLVAILIGCALMWAQPAAAQSATNNKLTPREALTKQLVSLGLSQQEAQSKVDQLTTAEIAQLAQQPDQVGMGGIQDKTLIWIAIILIIPSVLLLVAI